MVNVLKTFPLQKSIQGKTDVNAHSVNLTECGQGLYG